VSVTDDEWVAEMRRPGAGWLAFAGAVLVLGGLRRILNALWAFKYDDEIGEEVQTVLFENDLAAWGWVWLILGIALVVAGFMVVQGAQWARWFGIVAASLWALLNYTWVFVQPFWALFSVFLAMLVIYALVNYATRPPTTTGPDRG
jgi:hypothetical protein